MNAQECFKVGNLTVKIYQDEDPQSPETYGDDEVFIVTGQNRYFEVIPKGFSVEVIQEHLRTHKRYNGFKVYLLYAYIHSGVALSLGREYPFSCQWDSGQIGFVLVKFKGNRKHNKLAEGIVDEWNMYLSGDVWGVVVEDENGGELESCWGFYGIEYALKEAREMAQGCIESERKRVCTESEGLGLDR